MTIFATNPNTGASIEVDVADLNVREAAGLFTALRLLGMLQTSKAIDDLRKAIGEQASVLAILAQVLEQQNAEHSSNDPSVGSDGRTEGGLDKGV